MTTFRTERDTLGEVQLPADAYYGAQTARAVENFPISGLKAHPAFIRAYVRIKRAAAQVNQELGQLDKERAGAIIQAADEVLAGQLIDQFVVDVYQAGAGTSFNMNVNEVLANRAEELLGNPRRGTYLKVHPNDHVNLAQSTNDSFPTAMRLAALELAERLGHELGELYTALETKALDFAQIIKSARTHLQDAVPITMGQVFGGYASTVKKSRARLAAAANGLRELNMGGTAAGTGLNSHPRYRFRMAEALAELTGQAVRPAENLVELTQSLSDFLHFSSGLRLIAVDLTKIANDLRLLSSGPRTGLAELELPPVQPGSSIMPGKVNPVIAEMLNMVCYQVMGCDLAALLGAQAGQLELNVMMPLVNYNLLFSQTILANAVHVFTERCVKGITADAERCRHYFEASLGLATALNPYIGYAQAAEVAKAALASGRTIREEIEARGLLPQHELEQLMQPGALTGPKSDTSL